MNISDIKKKRIEFFFKIYFSNTVEKKIFKSTYPEGVIFVGLPPDVASI